MTLSRTSNSATESLFGQSVPPELDPAQLLDELRALRPLIDRLSRLEPVLAAVEEITVAEVQAFRRALQEHSTVMARLEHVGPQITRIEELLELLDQLDVIVRRQ